MHRSLSFHPNLLISDHFENVINQIDIATEIQLEKALNIDETNQLNLLRDNQIKIIKEILKMHLTKLGKYSKEQHMQISFQVLNNPSLKNEEKVDLIKEKIIDTDCLIIENSPTISKLSLWIVPWFYNSQSLEFIKFDFKTFLNLKLP